MEVRVVILVLLSVILIATSGLSQNSFDLNLSLSQPLGSTNWKVGAAHDQYGEIAFIRIGFYQKKLNFLGKQEYILHDIGIGLGKAYSTPLLFATLISEEQQRRTLKILWFASSDLKKVRGWQFSSRVYGLHLFGFTITKKEGALVKHKKVARIKLGLKRLWSNFSEAIPVNFLVGVEFMKQEEYQCCRVPQGLTTEVLYCELINSPFFEITGKVRDSRLTARTRLGKVPKLHLEIEISLPS